MKNAPYYLIIMFTDISVLDQMKKCTRDSFFEIKFKKVSKNKVFWKQIVKKYQISFR